MNFEVLRRGLEGELFTNEAIKRIYATDTSAYREVPTAVAFPKSENDLKKLIEFAYKNKTALIPEQPGPH
ncbi:MAG: hypothetical protein AAF620_06310 [Bacteroidota bacterium]